jgi:tetratricopeptide (TPR) repeat protein
LVKQLVVNHPEVSAVHREVGRLELAKKNLSAARTALEKAVNGNSGDTEALALLVRMDLDASKRDLAKARIERATTNNPRDGGVLVFAARVQAELGDYARSEELLRRAIEVDPARNEAYGVLGQLYAAQGRVDQALREFETLAQREPKSIGAHTIMGTLLQAQSRRVEAKAAYRRALSIDATAPVSANNLAWMFAEDNENLEEALRLAQVAKTRLPDSPDVADTLGWVYYRMGVAKSAVPFFREAAEKQPANASFQYHLGLAAWKSGEVTAARKALETALKLDPKAPEAAEARDALAKLALVGS